MKTLKRTPLKRPPAWIPRSDPFQPEVVELKKRLRKAKLVTVCEEAKCPNIGHCFSMPTATFMILGKTCSRHCPFCAVEGKNRLDLPPPDPSEPEALASSVVSLGLKHVVITMVARDDLPDGGSRHLVRCIEHVQDLAPSTRIEVLTSDFKENQEAIERVSLAKPHIFNHNVETIPRLQKEVRHRSSWERSIAVLKKAKDTNPNMLTKSGMMVGLGETKEEVIHALQLLREADCDMLTIGQYLSPGKKNLSVQEYIHPDLFKYYESAALEMGFVKAFCGPNIRSSYMADEQFQ